MANELNVELDEFSRFVSDRLSEDQSLTLEEALDLWREANASPADFEENVAALREALDEIDKGARGIPIDEFDRRFRERHSLPPRP
jgi:hypothetical protein